MFALLLLGLGLGAAIHIARSADLTARRAAEIGLVWILVGYCGVGTLLVSLLSLIHPTEIARRNGFPPGNPYQTFASVCFLAMSITSMLALRYRATYLIAPATLWSIFFAGATIVHLANNGEGGQITHGGKVEIFLTHGLISVLLIVGLVMSRAEGESA